MADRVTFAYGNAMDLDYPDASFDAAWSIDCFPHLSDRPTALHEADRVMRPGGFFLLTELTARSRPEQAELTAYRKLMTSPPPTSLVTLVGEVEQTGFRVVELHSMRPSIVLLGELMYLLYHDQHGEIEQRYGDAVTGEVDPMMAPFRAYFRHRVEYYLLLLQKQGAS